MNWQSYEELVKGVYETLGESENIEIVCWGRACKVRGKSGVYHQVDVLTRHSDGIHSYRTAIECKYQKKKTTKDPIAKLSNILEDAQIEKGVVVSLSGFTSDAKALAKSRNISLVELRRPIDDDWEGQIRDVHISMHVSRPEAYDYEFVQDEIGDNSQSRHFGALNVDVLFHTPDGKSISLYDLTYGVPPITDPNARHVDSLGFHWIDISSRPDENAYAVMFPDATMMSVPTNDARARAKIRGIRFKLRYSEITQEIAISGADYVALVMHAIFEKKRFAISPDGEIREWGRTPRLSSEGAT